MQKIEMIGNKYGWLTVLDEAGKRGIDRMVRCLCDCGNEYIARAASLRYGSIKSCGKCQTYIEEADFMRCVCRGGRSFVFDKSDYSLVEQHKWSVDSKGYVAFGRAPNKIHLTRLLMQVGDDVVINHINGNPSDNRRANLRLATTAQVSHSQQLRRNNTSGYKGVSFDSRRQMYVAMIHPDRKGIFLGYFADPKDAAQAYDEAAIK